jgi:hypothetical protein
LFGWKEPLNVEQALAVAESKRVIYEGISIRPSTPWLNGLLTIFLLTSMALFVRLWNNFSKPCSP